VRVLEGTKADNVAGNAIVSKRKRIRVEPRSVVSKPPAQLAPLTSLRFFAALLVVFAHFGVLGIPPALGSLPFLRQATQRIGDTGYVGVNFFFLLSGFILAYTYLLPNGRLRGSGRAFYVARFARIYPAYLLGFAMFAVAIALWHGYAWNSPQYAGILAQHPLGVVITTFSMTQTWIPFWAEVFNPPAWSLSVELVFYALFPLLGVFIGRLRPDRLLAAALLLWILALAPATVVWLFGASLSPDGLWILHFTPIIRVPEFLSGVALGRLFVLRRTAAPRPIPNWVMPIVLLLLCCGVILGPSLPNDLMLAGLLDPLWLLLIYVAACGTDRTSRILTHPWMVVLGEASYALYILHFPVWVWMTHAVPWPGYGGQGAVYYLVYLGITIIASIIVLRVLETPARRAIRAALA
jgi:peptidoglycan/LPS O-acetylase OafA/YrhL